MAANIVDLSTIIGRVVAALRQETNQSQAVFAAHLGWDRSLLARIESGRNTANVDNIFELEEAFVRSKLMRLHGELVLLTAKVVAEANARGLRAVYGSMARPEGDDDLPVPYLDRIVARVVDDWLSGLRDDGRE